MATRPPFQEYIDAIEGVGGHVTHCDEGKKHVKIYFTGEGGKERFYVAPKTPSDWRGIENAKSQVRRMLTGLSEPQTKVFVDAEVDENEEPTAITSFGGRLRYLREQKQMTRERLAEEAGLNAELIEHFEVLPEQPFLDYETVLKLSTALGTTLSFLVGEQKLEGVPDMSDLAKRVRTRRNELGLTIGGLAARTGIPNQQLANLETGTYPDFYRMQELAKGLECSEEFLREGKKELQPMPISREILDNIKTEADFGKFIQDRRYDLNLTQLEVARALGQSYAVEISRGERGINLNLFMKNLDKLATILELPYDELKKLAERVRPDGLIVPQGKKRTSMRPQAPIFEHEPATSQDVPQPAPVQQVQPVSPPAPVQLESHEQLEAVMAAVRVEGRLTREVLERQHQELMTSLKATQTQGFADILHTLIDNLFKKG